MRSLFYALILFPIISQVAFAADISFQGLNGTSTKKDVLKVFPNATVKTSICRAGDKVWKTSEGDYSCSQLSIGGYVVDNHPYDLIFAFSVEGKLRFALLTRSFGGAYFEHFSKRDLQQQYQSLYDALNYKYGDPLEESQTLQTLPTDCIFGNYDSGFRYGQCSEWQSGANQKFEPGQSHIKLELSAQSPQNDLADKQTRPDDYDRYIGDMSVSYKFPDVKSAGKL